MGGGHEVRTRHVTLSESSAVSQRCLTSLLVCLRFRRKVWESGQVRVRRAGRAGRGRERAVRTRCVPSLRAMLTRTRAVTSL